MDKHKKAKEMALNALRSLVDRGDVEGLGKPLESSGMSGEVKQAQSFADGGVVPDGKEPAYMPDGEKAAMHSDSDIGSGDHDETSSDDFGAEWTRLTGRDFRTPKDTEGLGGDSDADGDGNDAASGQDEEMSDDEKAKLAAAYNRHVLGKR